MLSELLDVCFEYPSVHFLLFCIVCFCGHRSVNTLIKIDLFQQNCIACLTPAEILTVYVKAQV